VLRERARRDGAERGWAHGERGGRESERGKASKPVRGE